MLADYFGFTGFDNVYISPEDVRWLNDESVRLNRAIQDGVNKFKDKKDASNNRQVTFVPVLQQFSGHGLCDRSSSWVNPVDGLFDPAKPSGPNNPNVPVSSFHPTFAGQKYGYEKAFLATNIGTYQP